METISASVVRASLSASKGCRCLRDWIEFQACREFSAYVKQYEPIHALSEPEPQKYKPSQSKPAMQSELQQGVFNDTGELGTRRLKHVTIRTKKPTTEKTAIKSAVKATSPPGWKTNVEHLKKDHPEVGNPYALTWWQKNQGEHSHLHKK